MKRWLFTAFSFTVVIGVSIYSVRSNAPDGMSLFLSPLAHALAFLAFLVEVASRALKLSWGAKAVGTRLPFMTGVRTSLGGDFGASITPARLGAEPARYLILAESGIGVSEAMVVMYTELFFEMISLAIVAALIVFLFDASATATAAMTSLVGLYGAIIIGLGVCGALLARRNPGPVAPPWAMRVGLHGARWAFIQRFVDRSKATVAAFKTMHWGWGTASGLASVVHVGVRFTILPALVLTMTNGSIPLGPLVVWPFTLIYGAGVMPAPAGGGAVELAFRAVLGNTIPASIFAASLVWWRFYTFYLYIALGALVAGNTALRAIREAEDVEEELERA